MGLNLRLKRRDKDPTLATEPRKIVGREGKARNRIKGRIGFPMAAETRRMSRDPHKTISSALIEYPKKPTICKTRFS
jgi:hypothetical protein